MESAISHRLIGHPARAGFEGPCVHPSQRMSNLYDNVRVPLPPSVTSLIQRITIGRWGRRRLSTIEDLAGRPCDNEFPFCGRWGACLRLWPKRTLDSNCSGTTTKPLGLVFFSNGSRGTVLQHMVETPLSWFADEVGLHDLRTLSSKVGPGFGRVALGECSVHTYKPNITDPRTDRQISPTPDLPESGRRIYL